MKILVAYYTQTGNTQKVAEAILREASEGHDAEIINIADLDPENIDCDIIFLGSPCHSSDIALDVKDFMNRIPEGPGFRLVGFVTHAAPTLEEIGVKEVFERWVGKAEPTFIEFCNRKGVEFAGFFNCQGVASPEVKEFIREHVYKGQTEKYLEHIKKAESHPDENDLENAGRFARGIIGE